MTGGSSPAAVRGSDRKRFALFLATSGFAAGVNIASRWLFSLAIPYEWAVVAAYLCGMLTAYVLARILVFERSGRRVPDELVRFGLVNVVALAQVWLVSVGLARVVFPAIDFTFHAEDLAHVVGVLSPALTSYLGHRYFSFSKRRVSDEKH